MICHSSYNSPVPQADRIGPPLASACERDHQSGRLLSDLNRPCAIVIAKIARKFLTHALVSTFQRSYHFAAGSFTKARSKAPADTPHW
jgi:hypothetical protein